MQPIRDLSDITHRVKNLMGYAAYRPGSILFESSGLRRFTHPTRLHSKSRMGETANATGLIGRHRGLGRCNPSGMGQILPTA